MREIKFRVFDPNTDEMIATDVRIGDISYYDFDGDNITEQEGLIIMQYTGLKDKNGVEIYEGDVVKADVGDGMLLSYKIIFEAGRFTMQDFGSECKSIWVLSDKCEVIGNIYEHTHLLDQ